MHFLHAVAWVFWDPSREAFKIPLVDHPVAWYGICFALGFFFAYLILQFILIKTLPSFLPLQTPKEASSTARSLLDSLTWYVVLGTIIGARLGHVLFYDASFYWENPLAVFRVWEGGLASHGGTLGILIALAIFYRRCWKPLMPDVPFLSFVDLFSIPIPLAAACIRIGNFFNQEIVGTPSSLPWGVVFGHPYEAASLPLTPRHPVQLYEAIAYFAIFLFLFSQWWKLRSPPSPPGRWLGWLFVLIFGARFFLEFWKSPQGFLFHQTVLQTGQLLSLPFILVGIILLIYFRGSSDKVQRNF